MKKRHLITTIALAAAGSLALAGCSNGAGDTEGGSGDGDSKGTITLSFMPGWTDGMSTAYLLEDQLGKLGYTVEMEELTDAAVIYAGLANGDFDMYPSAWSEATHSQYMDKYGDKIEDLGSYYEGASLTIAVPEYMDDINSIEDLKGKADRFGGEIIGIEPGAGLTAQTQDVMLPEYGLEGEYELVTSSTGAMLATLQSKIDAEEDVVVTLWRPFWANAAFPVKDLADPKGAMGGTEGLHFLGKLGFGEEFPEAADYIEGIKLDDDAYGALESLITSDDYKGDPEGAVQEWLKDNADAYPGIIA
ncbi:glycine betaine ABC transporter substrate-binding protein [Leucobacter aridicollis]|uniref:Glycine betaine/proline transport system substrate-binding protein n=1 Tax=Leucobacter aridicollis TaxID=283878 RepID=A0A852R8J0_9MICO|nr:glycine betaine ABC transporter substrate-binding protein [Leucobacter aridicollis]MBL3682201.1 glycine betaine ABC transporter substrate-binding protein [Leucobacter aridicollis]NYD26749.1 glycine betaine/proline transport system substrate-binding protein [Leucobacter aridicollis]